MKFCIPTRTGNSDVLLPVRLPHLLGSRNLQFGAGCAGPDSSIVIFTPNFCRHHSAECLAP